MRTIGDLYNTTTLKFLFSVLLRSSFLHFAHCLSMQEDSLQCGLAYVVSIVAMFDEYTNDVLNLNEGSCLPRYLLVSWSLVQNQAQNSKF